ncbi:hypothetical protein [Thalassospira sp. MCCC 1A02491]|uniref:hypothetical protein n=1 Tax=Thalassospira sp. MCCC 1A02491 TaxID=1769751 RepID=UPI0007AD75CF|nr:hypothetical protein [Thalassospira sp. MCCC 1A02491]KZB58477.1 hypothetical protein AUQ42_09760 [Thalassospira sp. MCCC 1A02491]
MGFSENLKNAFRYQHLPKFIDWLVHLSNFEARKLISQKKAHRILIDNSVIGYGITHETAWVSTGEKLWGGVVSVDTGYAARIPVYSDDDSNSIAKSVKYLPPIIDLAKSSTIKLYRSLDLLAESLNHPQGRYRGYDYYDLSLFKRTRMPILPDLFHHMNISSPRWLSPNFYKKLQERQNALILHDERIKELIGALGKKNSQDAIHIATAERNECYCFLTMDFRLIKAIESQKGHPAIKSLKTLVLSPEQFGKQFKIRPILTRFYSYHDASFPVEHSENWEDSKRKGRNNN